MVNRPKRERKPTQQFEYRDASVTPSIAGDDASTAQQATSPSKPRKSTRVKNLNVALSNERSDGRNGQVRSVKSKDGGKTPAGGQRRSRRQNADFDTNESPDAGLNDTIQSAYSERQSIRDTWETLNESDFDGDNSIDDEDDTTLSNPANTKKRCIAAQKEDDLAHLRKEDDIVIEQWYADPYERINPDGISFDQWRYQNLQFGMMNQGFSMIKAKAMASWLLRCNGRYKDFEASRSKSGVRKPRKRARAEKSRVTESVERTASDLAQNNEDQTSAADIDETLNSATESVATSHSRPVSGKLRRIKNNTKSNIATTARADQQKMLGDSQSDSLREPEYGKRKEDEENGRETNLLSVDVDDTSDERQLDMLKRNLKLFDVVYGPGGPRADPTNFSHSYFSRASALPILVPTTGLTTQGHYTLQQGFLPADNPVFLNGIHIKGEGDCVNTEKISGSQTERGVLTEDPDFGLTLFSVKDTATDEEMKQYYLEFERRNKVGQTLSDVPTSVKPSIADDFMVDGMSNEEDRRMLAYEQNQENAAIIAEELKQRIFEWETPYTMGGGAPKASKDDKLWEGAFAVRERHVWKEIVERRSILEEGGEAAAKLLEKEWEAEQRKIKREDRRRQNAQSKARKLAARGEGGSGISGWFPED